MGGGGPEALWSLEFHLPLPFPVFLVPSLHGPGKFRFLPLVHILISCLYAPRLSQMKENLLDGGRGGGGGVVCDKRDVETTGRSYCLADNRRWGTEEGRNSFSALLTSAGLSCP